MFHYAHRLMLAVALLTICFTPSISYGVAYTWNGGTGNWDIAGSWSPGGGPPGSGVGDTGAINSGTATANAQLPNSPAITVGSTGILSINALTTSATDGGVTINNRVEYVGATTGSTDIDLQNGSTFGKLALNAATSTFDDFTIGTGNTATANNIQATNNSRILGLQFLGSLSGDGVLVVDSSGVGNRHGALTLAPASANSFDGTVNVSGFGGIFGTLVLSGDGALRNVGALNLAAGANLKLIDATNPLPASSVIAIDTGERIDWAGTQTYTLLADRPTITLNDGSNFGRYNETLNVGNDVTETINITSGDTATASRISATHSGTTAALSLVGSLNGDATTTLQVDPQIGGNTHGALRIAPTSANTGFLGNVLLQSSNANLATLVLGGTGALSNIAGLTISTNGQLRLADATNPFGTSAFQIDVGTTGRMEWAGTQTYTGTAANVLFRDGSFLGKTDSLNVGATQTEAIAFDSTATVQAANIAATGAFTSAALTLAGPITGAANTTLLVQPTAGGNTFGVLRIAPSSANTGFFGSVVLEGGTGGGAGRLGGLVLGGTGALSDIGSLTVNSGGLLRLADSTDPLPAAFPIVIAGGARMEWEGTQTYNIAQPTVLLEDGSFIGRLLTGVSTSTEAITIDTGATVTANQIGGTTQNTVWTLSLEGALSGAASSKLVVSHTNLANQWGNLQLNPSSANPYAGSVEVTGATATNQGVLNLNGTGPLANASLLEIQQFGTTLVNTVGAADGIDEIRVLSGGTLRFRDNSFSSLSDSTLSGTGLVRAEAVVASPLADGALRSLILDNTIISPGTSAGTLTIEALSVTMGTDTTLISELGATSDLLQIDGDLTLTAGSTLQLEELAGLTVGTHIIANYTGTLTGTFGDIQSNIGGMFAFSSIDYGTLSNSFISVTIAQVPEPASGLLIALGGLPLMMVRRRNRNRS